MLGNALSGAWWLDPAVGLLIAAVALQEGLEADAASAAVFESPLPATAEASCREDCCD